MNLPTKISPAALLAVGVAIGAALGVALDNMAFLGAGVAIGAAFMAIQSSKDKSDSDRGDDQ